MAMKWRKSSEVLVAKFSALVPEDPSVERRKMFGYPAAFVGGNLFMGLHREALILRLSEKVKPRGESGAARKASAPKTRVNAPARSAGRRSDVEQRRPPRAPPIGPRRDVGRGHSA